MTTPKPRASRDLTVADLKRAAARVGATVQEVRHFKGEEIPHDTFLVDAPAGKVWSCSFIHTLDVTYSAEPGHPAARADKQDSLRDALERIADGLEDCGDDECEICHPADICEYCWLPATHGRTLPEDAADHPDDPKAARHLYCKHHAPADATPLPRDDES